MRDIRNIAVIAHVDHGKTTLVDQLLKQSGTFSAHQNVDERVMDSNAIEKERGITILSKNTAIDYEGVRINIIDTPGHADFGGEVERVLKMVDSVLLLVDAQEGVMPQTKFVVKKALSLGHRPIVVVNKIDKPAAEPERVVDEVFDLFAQMDATEEQLDFPVIYAAARDGLARYDATDGNMDFKPLYDTILKEVPKPLGADENGLQLQVFTLDYDNFIGKIGIARIFNGTISHGETVMLCKADGEKLKGRVSKLIGFKGMERFDIKTAGAGDIVAVAGFETIDVGDSLCDPNNPMPLDPMHIEEPTLSVTFSVNDSPLAGTEGKFVTSNKIDERLKAEMNTNIAMSYEQIGEGKFKVNGRGELQITILAENMRREGFEFCIGRPEVIIKEENGVKMEPFEKCMINVPDESAGAVIEQMGKRRGIIQDMKSERGLTFLEFSIPTRGLLGFRREFTTMTRGEGILASAFDKYAPYGGDINKREVGSMISACDGAAMTFSLFNLQERGPIFIEPQTEVYEGMIVGEHLKGSDLIVNVIKNKQLTNMRASGTDEAMRLTPPRVMSLEDALDYVGQDEYVEITPTKVRLRKKKLKEHERKRG